MDKKLIDELDEMHEAGTLARLAAAGFISPSVLLWRNVYHSYKEAHALCGLKMQAMEDTAENFGLSVRTVQYIRDRVENF